jgi:hypothetical protein
MSAASQSFSRPQLGSLPSIFKAPDRQAQKLHRSYGFEETRKMWGKSGEFHNLLKKINQKGPIGELVSLI